MCLCRCLIPQIWSCRWAPELLLTPLGALASATDLPKFCPASDVLFGALFIPRAGVFRVDSEARSSPCSRGGPCRSSSDVRVCTGACCSSWFTSVTGEVDSQLPNVDRGYSEGCQLHFFPLHLNRCLLEGDGTSLLPTEEQGRLGPNLAWPRAEDSSLVCDPVGLHVSSKHTKWAQLRFLHVMPRC